MKIANKILFITAVVVGLISCQEDEFTDWGALNTQWLEQHRTDDGFLKTESGIYYKIIHEGELRNPNSDSYVDIDYTGWLIDGTEFDSGSFQYYLPTAIAGWQEIVQKMKDGARFVVYIPSDLAYGADGSTSGDIPPYSTLIFDMTLIKSEN